MNNDKRFTEIISIQKVIDNQTGKEYDCLIDDELLKLLNDLAEEKEMWKRECERLKGLYYLKNEKTDEYLAWKRVD